MKYRGMILSMTGFGRSEAIFKEKRLTVEIKSLNSKNFDLNMRIPIQYKEKEFEIRKMLNDAIIRGKIDCLINCEILDEKYNVKINKDLIRSYIDELKECANDGPEFEYLKMAVRLPDAISSKPDDLNDEEWNFLEQLIKEALLRFKEFRKSEGLTLQNELLKYVQNIAKNLSEILPYEESRIDNVKDRFQKALQEFNNIDETRFYQELSYYVEKLDISEEKVRLAQHLNYYQEVAENEILNGRKLGFISQEIGREINTIGSKANHSEIQKLIVKMKDDLERIKEQTLNVL